VTASQKLTGGEHWVALVKAASAVASSCLPGVSLELVSSGCLILRHLAANVGIVPETYGQHNACGYYQNVRC
jgi:hypothetical protein